ncbi:hypothetical protein E4631_13295 [Hymenobacter sp. UV11]|uniref:hypothetical protein n=1 Tax=Hymenobacter sp. UV11 TaxID=1849735 RepID=UPI00105FA8B0|nr:hypothetical protein [Hymenobacter sp. UV11]TDN36562.1 hypothetical protein A8B98_07655 [Hymenobacter sp. UV11]TFZ66062.1 hypothetical protein E4631_13295 [Hymenobacter sp. UV11]
MLKALGLVVLVVSLGGCGRRPTEQRVDVSLASKLIANNQLASFSFCKEEVVAWDSILVLKPYCPLAEVERFGINNYLTTKLLVTNQAQDDLNCTLVFLEKGSCVGYSVISRQIVDLSRLTNEKDFGFALITKHNCVKKLYRNKTYGGVSMVD